MTAGLVLRAAKLKTAGRIHAAAAHNLRVIQKELGSSGHIDPTRIGLNVHLAGPRDPSSVAKLAKDRMAAAGIGTLRKDAVRAIEFLVTLPADSAVDEDAFFVDAMHWLAERCGGMDNVLGADIHRDEAAPHMHLLILPLVGGRMNGSDMLGGKASLRSLATEFFRQVCAPHGLMMYSSRLQGDAKRRAVSAVVKELERLNDPALKSAIWTLIHGRIEADPRHFAELLGINVSASAKPKRRRTMTDIFISPGRGPKREPAANCKGAAPALDLPAQFKVRISEAGLTNWRDTHQI